MWLVHQVDRFVLKIGNVASLCFLLCLVLTLKEVFWRYALGAPSSWAQDASTMLSAIGFAFGGSYALAETKHIRVTVVSDHFPRSLQIISEKASLAIGAVYLAALGYGLMKLTTSAVFRFPNGNWTPESTIVPPYLPIPSITKTALFVGTALFCTLAIIHLLTKRKGRTG